MSFYLMLSSDGCREVYPDNNGGDFNIIFDNAIDMKSDSWEVALVEIKYTGQLFPNLPTIDALITTAVSGKPKFEDQYIITSDKAHQLHFSFHSNEKDKYFKFPIQHYTWTSFKQTFLDWYRNEVSRHITITDEEFEFVDRKHTNFTIKFSDAFM